MIEYTTKLEGLKKYILNLKTNDLDLFMKIESEIYKAKCKEENIKNVTETKTTVNSKIEDIQSDEKKTISIKIDIS